MSNKNEAMEISVVMDEIAKLHAALGVAPLNTLPGPWVHTIDEHWRIALNGHKTDTDHNGTKIPPFHCFTWFNGWPAGLFGPFGGTFAAGSLANEDNFIAAIRAAAASAERESVT